MGIASLIMPGLTGIIADKWINAERLYGILHLIGAGALIYASTATTYNHMYWAMLLNMLVTCLHYLWPTPYPTMHWKI